MCNANRIYIRFFFCTTTTRKNCAHNFAEIASLMFLQYSFILAPTTVDIFYRVILLRTILLLFKVYIYTHTPLRYINVSYAVFFGSRIQNGVINHTATGWERSCAAHHARFYNFCFFRLRGRKQQRYHDLAKTHGMVQIHTHLTVYIIITVGENW